MKKIIASPNAPKAVGPYSQAVENNGTIYVSGQLPIDASTGKMAEGIEEQTRQSLTNIGHILREAGYDYADVAKVTVLLDDIGDFAAMNGVYAMSAITALTAQNTLGVRAILEVTPDFLKEQLDAVFEDIFPDSVKIGMVSSSELIEVIADRLNFYNARNIVVDPVMVATSGSELSSQSAVDVIQN